MGGKGTDQQMEGAAGKKKPKPCNWKCEGKKRSPFEGGKLTHVHEMWEEVGQSDETEKEDIKRWLKWSK